MHEIASYIADQPRNTFIAYKTPITTAIQEATCNMQVASLQAATSKLQQNISQPPEKQQAAWAQLGVVS